jgi:catechol 2,3-dioxygenase
MTRKAEGTMSSTTARDHHGAEIDTRDRLTYGAVHLDVVDGNRSLAFWRDLIGLAEIARTADAIHLGVDGHALIALHPGAERGPVRGCSGLYHVAIHLPNEVEFARVLARIAAAGVPQAPTDHIFSKATYLSDPDGIQLELTLETPERAGGITVGPASVTIRDASGRLRGMTEPLDVREVLSHLTDRDLDRRLPIGTTVGHVHLHVADLEATRRFYTDVIGFEEHTYVPGIGFADLSAGGRFPHRFAFNTWQGEGAPPPPDGTAGLRFFELVVERGGLLALRDRLASTEHPYELEADTLITRDPSGNELRLAERVGGRSAPNPGVLSS